MEATSLFLGFIATVMNAAPNLMPGTSTAQQVLQATSDAFQGDLDLQVLVDGDQVATGLQATSGTKTESYDLSQLTNGLVLYTYSGHNVVILTSSDFDPTHGGTFNVSYLVNGLTNNYGSITVDLERNGSQWQLLGDDQSGHQVVTQAYFKANKVFGQTVGISSITLSP
jgi:hypothetical protein